MKRSHYFILSVLLPVVLCACSRRPVSREFYAMDTVMQLRAYGSGADAALSAAEDETYRLESLLSCRNPEAELARLNAAGGGTASEETAALIQTALALSAQTGGAYDPTLAQVSAAWGFSGEACRVPDAAELAALLQKTGTAHVSVNDRALTLSGGVQLDLGGIAKGYTAGRIRRLLTGAGISSAIISLGGNIAAIGTRPDGTAWVVGLQDPDDPQRTFGSVSITDACVVTSGSYQRFFEQDGVRYHHILDPKTGFPAESGLKSVSVVAEDDTLADALSTALFVMGLEAGAAFQRTGGLSFEAIFVTDGGDVWITPGLSGVYRSDRPYQVLSS